MEEVEIVPQQEVLEIHRQHLHHKVIMDEMVMAQEALVILLQVVGVVLLLRELLEYIIPLEVFVVLEPHHLSQE